MRNAGPPTLLLLLLLTPLVCAGAEKVSVGSVTEGEAGGLLQGLAESGQIKAQVVLGEMYLEGEGGVVKDPVAARHWFLVAAERGDPEAQRNLALMYQIGRGGPADQALAEFWFQKARGQGDVFSHYKSGAGYSRAEVP